MKKLIVFLLVVQGAIGVVFGQEKYPPIQKYNESGYTTDDLKAFMFRKTELAVTYRQKFLTLINKALRESGEYVNVNHGEPLTQNNITWIMEHTTIKRESYSGFINSYNKDGKTEFFFDKNNFDGLCFYFSFRTCGLAYGKTICENLIDVGFEIIGDAPANPGSVQKRELKIVEDEPKPLNVVDDEPKRLYVPEKPCIIGPILLWTARVVGTARIIQLIVIYANDHKKPAGKPVGTPINPGTPDGGGPVGTPINPGQDVAPHTSIMLSTTPKQPEPNMVFSVRSNTKVGFSVSRYGFSIGGVLSF